MQINYLSYRLFVIDSFQLNKILLGIYYWHSAILRKVQVFSDKKVYFLLSIPLIQKREKGI